MRPVVAEYRLSLQARTHLYEIYEYGARRFGRYQAEAYHAGLERNFTLIAEFAGIGASSDELAPGLRRLRVQSHYIFFTNEGDHVVVRALIHVRKNLRPELFE